MWAKTSLFAEAGGDSNNNDTASAGKLTPPNLIPKYPIRTTRPPSVSKHPDGYYVTSFDLRSFIDAPPASASTSSSVSGDSAGSAGRRFFERGTGHPAGAASVAFPTGLVMPSVPKVGSQWKFYMFHSSQFLLGLGTS